VNTLHEAWWFGIASFSAGQYVGVNFAIGPFGLVRKGSERSGALPACPPPPSGGGGGGGGTENRGDGECWDVYFVLRANLSGEIVYEESLFSICCHKGGCAAT